MFYFCVSAEAVERSLVEQPPRSTSIGANVNVTLR